LISGCRIGPSGPFGHLAGVVFDVMDYEAIGRNQRYRHNF
jgi:hypothetical protein